MRMSDSPSTCSQQSGGFTASHCARVKNFPSISPPLTRPYPSETSSHIAAAARRSHDTLHLDAIDDVNMEHHELLGRSQVDPDPHEIADHLDRVRLQRLSCAVPKGNRDDNPATFRYALFEPLRRP